MICDLAIGSSDAPRARIGYPRRSNGTVSMEDERPLNPR
jgi:hypothetical protein